MNLRLAVSIVVFLSLYLHANAYNERETRRQTGLKRRFEVTPPKVYPEKRRASVGAPARSYPEKRRASTPSRLHPENRRASPVRTPARLNPEKRRAATVTNARRLSNAKPQTRRSNAERKTLNAVRRVMPAGRKLPARKVDTVQVVYPIRNILPKRRADVDDDELDNILDPILKYIFSEIQKLDIIPSLTDDHKIIAPDEKMLEDSFEKLLELVLKEIAKYTKKSENTRRMNNAGPPVTRRMNNAGPPVTRRFFSDTPMRKSDSDEDEELDKAIDTILRLFFSEFQKLNITSCLGAEEDEVIIRPSEEELDSALDYLLDLILSELQKYKIIAKEESRRAFQNKNISRRSEFSADDLDIAIENILKFMFAEIQKHNEAIVPSDEKKIIPPENEELQASFEVIVKLIMEDTDTLKTILDENENSRRVLNTRKSEYKDISEEELDSAIESILKVIFSEIQKYNISSCMGLDPDDESITPPSSKELDTALDNILNLIFHEFQKHSTIPTEGNNRRMEEEDDSEPVGIFAKIYNFLFKKAKPAPATAVETPKEEEQNRRNQPKLDPTLENVVKLLFQEIGKLQSQNQQ